MERAQAKHSRVKVPTPLDTPTNRGRQGKAIHYYSGSHLQGELFSASFYLTRAREGRNQDALVSIGLLLVRLLRVTLVRMSHSPVTAHVFTMLADAVSYERIVTC